MEKFIHYGVEVVVQSITEKFEDQLKELDIPYIELPLIEDKVLRYIYNGQKKYAYITYSNIPDEYREKVYITTEIPEDMCWRNIELDYRGQMDNEEPRLLPSRARVLYDKAEEIIKEDRKPTSFLNWIDRPDKKEIKLALLSLGITWDELKEMNHYDVSDSELNDEV